MNNPSEFQINKSPRRELQGPRPTPLRVNKDSHKIRKPPVVPQQHHHHQQQQSQQPRPPVIIYTVSPKVIHTNPSEFMTLVQRLTGSSSSSSSLSSSSSSSLSSSFPINDHSGDVSPAARFATIERIKSSPKVRNHQKSESNMSFVESIEMGHGVDRTSLCQGILSPGPTSLPPISPSFFSPPSDPNFISFMHDLSPMVYGNKNFIEGSFMPSPSSFVSPRITSPTPSIDLFNNFFDF